MNILEKTFTRKSFVHNQIKRDGKIAIYERWKANPETKHYEVVKIGSHNGYTIAGQFVAPSEVYPSSTAWGVTGWTYNTINEAEKKFKQLVAEQSTPKAAKV